MATGFGVKTSSPPPLVAKIFGDGPFVTCYFIAEIPGSRQESVREISSPDLSRIKTWSRDPGDNLVVWTSFLGIRQG